MSFLHCFLLIDNFAERISVDECIFPHAIATFHANDGSAPSVGVVSEHGRCTFAALVAAHNLIIWLGAAPGEARPEAARGKGSMGRWTVCILPAVMQDHLSRGAIIADQVEVDADL